MKKILSLLIALMVVISSVAVFAADTTTEAIKFSDVNADTTTGAAIYKLVNAGILNGYLDGTFKPDNTLTRAELCKIINLVFGYTEADAENFKDVKKEDWFYDYVAVAKKAGYINGFEDGTFRGNEKLTREQSCAIIARVGGLYELPMTEKITDKVSDWAVPYVNKVVANKLMTLEEGGKFRATENITRGELTLVASTFVLVEEEPVKTEITVTVKKEGNGKTTGEGKYEIGKEVKVTATPELGYTFGGWIVNGTNVSKKASYTFKAEKDITLTAKFEKESAGGGGGGGGGSFGGGSSDDDDDEEETPPAPTYYTVTFNTDGGSAVAPQTIEKGKTATKPADPTRAGFKFAGWYTSAACTTKYDFDTAVTSKITIWADWEVEFDAELQKTVRNSVKEFYDELVVKLDPIEGELYEDFTTDILVIVKDILKEVIYDADVENIPIYDETYIRTEYDGLIDDAKDIYIGLDVTNKGKFEADILGTFNRNRADELLIMIFGVGLDDIKNNL